MTASTSPRRLRAVVLLVVPVLAALAVACGSDSTTTSAGSNAATTTTAASSSSSTVSGSTGSKPAVAKVSANTASAAEIQAALTAAGVSNPGRWTDEVMEYRPYDTGDPSLSKLKKELAKYKPDQETLNKILSVLQP
jgi:hypothetical protein